MFVSKTKAGLINIPSYIRIQHLVCQQVWMKPEKAMIFLTSPISHPHPHNNGDDNEYQLSEGEVWHFAQVVEPEVEEGGVDPNLVPISGHHFMSSWVPSYLSSCHQVWMMFMLIHQGVVLDPHDGVVGEVDNGDVHQVGKCPVWKSRLNDKNYDNCLGWWWELSCWRNDGHYKTWIKTTMIL